MKKRFFYVAILSLLSLVSFGQGGYTPIPKLKITTTPETNNSTTEVLVRDATTGNVGKVAKSSLAGTLDSVTDAGATTNNVISTGGVGINTTTPQAIFDVVSTTSGVLIPRMTTNQRDAIVTPINSMLIYNSTTNQFEYYKFGSWISLTDSTTVSNLQTVTDSGATTTNNITIQGGEDDGVVTLFKNDETANVSVEWAENKVALSAKDNAVNFGFTNTDIKRFSGGTVTEPNQTYNLPDKPSGTYTLSTTSDLENLNSYSTTEKLTGGKWINNKPIYRKVIEYTFDSSGFGVSIPHGITNYENLVNGKIITPLLGKIDTMSANLSWGDCYVTSTNVEIENVNTFVDLDIKVILEYTKTTD